MPNPLYDALLEIHSGKSDPLLLLPDRPGLTYRDFLARAAQIAHVLTELGLVAGDRVAVQVQKSPEALAVYAACIQAGFVYLPLNTAYTAAELDYFIDDSGAALVICDGVNGEKLIERFSRHDVVVETLNPDGTGTLTAKAALTPESFETVDRDPDDLAAILYTSGTTGRSKGAMLTHNNLLSNAKVLVRQWRLSRDDVLLHALPIFHTHGLFVAINTMLAVGGRMIFLRKFSPDQVIEFLPMATTMMGVPTFYTRLLDDPRFSRELVSDIRLFVSGSAPLLAETHEQFEKRTGHRILERYGMTETGMLASNPHDGDRRAGSVGFALPGVELKITNPDNGETLENGAIGQIEVRGANVFKGYWRMPEKTAVELRPDGFFVTGDLGRFGDDGYLHIVGREKDLIISGGYNIYPREIERVLDDQPGVLESAVVGIPHPDFGETVLGVIVPEKDRSPDIDGIFDALGREIARFKHPRKLVVLDQLPRNAMGKVQKNLLRDAYNGVFAPTSD